MAPHLSDTRTVICSGEPRGRGPYARSGGHCPYHRLGGRELRGVRGLRLPDQVCLAASPLVPLPAFLPRVQEGGLYPGFLTHKF